MRNLDWKISGRLGVIAGILGLLLLPRILTYVAWCIFFVFLTVAGCWPAYLIGGFLSLVAWHFTETWPALPRLALRSLMIAMTVAPALVIGHGFAIAPAIWVAVIAIVEPSLALKEGLKPLSITWLIVAALIYLLSRLRTGSSNGPQEDTLARKSL
jgi:hypothetical protein